MRVLISLYTTVHTLKNAVLDTVNFPPLCPIPEAWSCMVHQIPLSELFIDQVDQSAENPDFMSLFHGHLTRNGVSQKY